MRNNVTLIKDEKFRNHTCGRIELISMVKKAKHTSVEDSKTIVDNFLKSIGYKNFYNFGWNILLRPNEWAKLQELLK